MSSVIEQSPRSRAEESAPKSRRDLRLAWTSTGLVIVATFVGRGVSFLLFALVVVVPTIAAVWFGLRAYHGGLQSGLTAATVAVVISGGLLLLGLPLFLGRLVGWPVVLALGLVVLTALGFVVSRGPRPHVGHL